MHGARLPGSLLVGLLLLGCGGSVGTTDTAGSGGSSGDGGGGGAAAGTGGNSQQCCLAAPTCDVGDTEIASEGECPIGATCYSNSICCGTIWCSHATVSCDPSSEPERDYVSTSPDQCTTVTVGCDSESFYFSNDCGCGCEKCPTTIDCAPKVCEPGDTACATGSPLCNSTECPNTLRAL